MSNGATHRDMEPQICIQYYWLMHIQYYWHIQHNRIGVKKKLKL